MHLATLLGGVGREWDQWFLQQLHKVLQLPLLGRTEHVGASCSIARGRGDAAHTCVVRCPCGA